MPAACGVPGSALHANAKATSASRSRRLMWSKAALSRCCDECSAAQHRRSSTDATRAQGDARARRDFRLPPAPPQCTCKAPRMRRAFRQAPPAARPPRAARARAERRARARPCATYRPPPALRTPLVARARRRAPLTPLTPGLPPHAHPPPVCAARARRAARCAKLAPRARAVALAGRWVRGGARPRRTATWPPRRRRGRCPRGGRR